MTAEYKHNFHKPKNSSDSLYDDTCFICFIVEFRNLTCSTSKACLYNEQILPLFDSVYTQPFRLQKESVLRKEQNSFFNRNSNVRSITASTVYVCTSGQASPQPIAVFSVWHMVFAKLKKRSELRRLKHSVSAPSVDQIEKTPLK